METYYVKEGRKYRPIGCLPSGHVWPGLWLIEETKCSRKKTNMKYIVQRVGDLKKPIDVVSMAALMTMSDGLASRLHDLFSEGNRLSNSDIANTVLAWIAENLETPQP